MSTKATIQTLIDTDLASASNITATEHRNTLKDDSDSLLNNLYPTVLTDSNATSTYITFTNASSWSAVIVKIGRKVTIDMDATASATLQLNVATIATGELTPDASGVYHTMGRIVGGDPIGVVVGSSGNISFQDTVFSGERVNFSITYNTLN